MKVCYNVWGIKIISTNPLKTYTGFLITFPFDQIVKWHLVVANNSGVVDSIDFIMFFAVDGFRRWQRLNTKPGMVLGTVGSSMAMWKTGCMRHIF